MRTGDMSPTTISRRLQRTSQLRALCLKLSKAKKPAIPPFPDLTAWRGAMRKFIRNRDEDSVTLIRRTRQEH
ncbi:MAG: hypothetical protein HYV35_01825 [Lentisphaerae bacterium]|nr:hypothetical protein [Lentisphaerota bacterium]